MKITRVKISILNSGSDTDRSTARFSAFTGRASRHGRPTLATSRAFGRELGSIPRVATDALRRCRYPSAAWVRTGSLVAARAIRGIDIDS